MEIRSKDQLAALVRDRRRQLRMSQAELALQIGGVSRQWVVELEAGRANPDFLTLRRLTDALNLGLNIGRGDEVISSVDEPNLDDVLDRLRK